jgi:alpha-ketoglutarate-dependent taurine dioxygenase
MKFKPDARRRKQISVYLYEEDIEFLKTWSEQQDMAFAQLTAQMVEHEIKINRAEVLARINKGD